MVHSRPLTGDVTGEDEMKTETIPSLKARLQQEHYQTREGFLVFTEAFHLKRGQCCGSGCRHCPFEPISVKGNTRLRADLAKLKTLS